MITEFTKIMFAWNKLCSRVQASSMMGLGTSNYEPIVEAWRVILIQAMGCKTCA